jgi:ATP/maltotriose-dependent transcriptional regulator MalT
MSVRLGQLQSGLELAQASAERARSAGNTYWYNVALGTACLAYLEEGKVAEAESIFRQMESSLSGSGPADIYLRGVLPQYRAEIALWRGDSVEALASAMEARKALGTDSGDKSGESRETLDVAARAEMQLAKLPEADADAQHALAIAEAVARGPDTSGNVGEALLVLAQIRVAQGRQAEAKPLLARAVRCLTNGLGPEHRLTREAIELQNKVAVSQA